MLQWNRYIEKADAEKKFIILLLPISIFLKNRNKYIAITITTGLRYPYGDEYILKYNNTKFIITIKKPNIRYINKSYLAFRENALRVVVLKYAPIMYSPHILNALIPLLKSEKLSKYPPIVLNK